MGFFCLFFGCLICGLLGFFVLGFFSPLGFLFVSGFLLWLVGLCQGAGFVEGLFCFFSVCFFGFVSDFYCSVGLRGGFFCFGGFFPFPGVCFYFFVCLFVSVLWGFSLWIYLFIYWFWGGEELWFCGFVF